MKIVNKQEFYNLPSGVLYSDFKPMIFENLKVKRDTLYDSNKIAIDFFYEDLIGNIDADHHGEFYDKIQEAIDKKISLPLDFNSFSRDGLFEESQLFAVYERKDIDEFIEKLKSLVALID